MRNISVITKIEVRESGDFFQDFPFQNQSASYSSETTKSAAGYSTKHTLTLSIAGLTEDTSARVLRLMRAEHIRITDINGTVMIMGSCHLSFKFEVTKTNSGKAGSWRGYRITIKFEEPAYPASQSFSIEA